jgi:hypothetical protein
VVDHGGEPSVPEPPVFPSDVPAGPSTTLYVGRVVYTVDVNGDFTLVSTRGTATDICAELS